MTQETPRMHLEFCSSFKQASKAARGWAREYRCDVVVTFDTSHDSWEVFVHGENVERFQKYESWAHDRKFDESCMPDVSYEEEEAPKPVFGADWSLL